MPRDDEEEEGLAHRLCAFIIKTINRDMNALFDKFVPVFDQDMESMVAQGETLEQYACYQEYLNVLQEYLSKFMLQEGYADVDSGVAILADLQKAVEQDKLHVEEQFRKTLAMIKAQRDYFREESGSPDDEDDCENQMLDEFASFFKPETVDDFMQKVLHMTEYETFSSLMRMKVQQVKFVQEMEQRKTDMMTGAMGLAHRFAQFALNVLNDELEGFYRRHRKLFDEEIGGSELEQGNTHEEYGAFQEYIHILEGHVCRFATQEGFVDDVAGLFAELYRLVKIDKERLDEQLMETIAEVQRERAMLRKDASGDEAEQEYNAPVILVCKPTSIGDLIGNFTRYTDFDFFNRSMRARCVQEKLMKLLFARQGEEVDEPERPAAITYPVGKVRSVHVGMDGSLYLSILVPEGAHAGTQLTVTAPDGTPIVATVPEGLSAGKEFEILHQPTSS